MVYDEWQYASEVHPYRNVFFGMRGYDRNSNATGLARRLFHKTNEPYSYMREGWFPGENEVDMSEGISRIIL